MSDKGSPRYNIGIDVGGTNTDGVLYDWHLLSDYVSNFQ